MPDLSTLFDAVYAAPEDDAPRLVLADVLMEQGHVRGEVIATQIRGEPLSAGQKAALRTHALDWLGPLRQAVVQRGLTYRRGFVAEATIRFRGPDQVAEMGTHPAWATIEVLTWSRDVNAWSKTAPSPLPALREAREVPDRAMQTLAHRRLPQLTSVSGTVSREETCDALLQCTGWPALRRLELSGRFRAAHRLDWLWDTPFAEQITELTLVRTRSFPGQGEDRILDLLSVVNLHRHIQRLVITHEDGNGRRGPTYTFLRREDDLDAVEVTSDQPVYRGELERDLHGLPIDDIRLVPGRGWTPPAFEPRPGSWPDRRDTRLPHRRVSAVGWTEDQLVIADHTALLTGGTVIEHEAPVHALATRPDGIAVAAPDIVLYTADGEVRRRISAEASHIAPHPEGWITVHPGGDVVLRDLDGDVLDAYRHHGAPYLLAVSPAGRVAVRHAPGITRVWWPGRAGPQRAHPGAVERLAWCGDASLLIADPRGALLVWPAFSPAPTRQQRVFEVGLFHQLAWSPDQQQVAVAWSDGRRRARVEIYDPELNRLNALSIGATEGLCIHWAPDSERLAIGRGTQVEIRSVATSEIIEWVR